MLIDEFNSSLTWIDTSAMWSTDGIILTDDPPTHYEMYKNIIPNADTQVFTNIPENGVFYVEGGFRGSQIIISSGLDSIYVSETLDFDLHQTIDKFQEIPGVNKWFVTSITPNQIRFNYGWLYVNAWLSESLVMMYETTNNPFYLDKSELILLGIKNYIDSNGRWRRYTLVDTEPIYSGMSQSILMRSILRFNENGNNEILYENLLNLATNHYHTTEGV